MGEPVHLDFAARRRPLVEVVFPEGEFTIDPNLYVDDVAELQAIEEAIKAADDNSDSETQALLDGRRAIMFYIRLRHPEAPEIRMTQDEIVGILAAMSGNSTLTQEVLDTLTAGIEAKDRAGDEPAGAEAGGAGGDEDGPLESRTPSRKRSSRSASTDSGRSRTGGASSRGGSSKV